MYSHAQQRAFSATALLYLAAALRSAAHRLRAAATDLDARIARRRSREACESIMCESCAEEPSGDTRELDRIAHLDMHVLKDIGAPHWLIAQAAERPDTEHLRWTGLDQR